jgi:hypothetical protein
MAGPVLGVCWISKSSVDVAERRLKKFLSTFDGSAMIKVLWLLFLEIKT